MAIIDSSRFVSTSCSDCMNAEQIHFVQEIIDVSIRVIVFIVNDLNINILNGKLGCCSIPSKHGSH